MFLYRQSTGEFSHDGVVIGTGYSGTGDGRNNPDMQAVRSVGPIPAGLYEIGPPYDTKMHGPHVLPLTPDGHDALGRSGFLIHGDSLTHDASHGCIILPREVRDLISESGDHELTVESA